MTDIRLICLDMDGTLLDDDHATVPARNIRALRAASERGAAVALASGRGWSLLRDAADQLGTVRYAVMSSGAAVLDLETGEWLYRSCLEAATWQPLVRVLLEEQLPFEVYCEGENVIQRDRFPSVLACALSPRFQDMLCRRTTLAEDLPSRLAGRAVEKIHVYRIPEARRAAVVERILSCGPLTAVTAFPGNLELNAPGVNKGAAVQGLCARRGWSAEQVMAFGDAGNDLELLSWAGWSFAMANATDQAKAAARYVTGSNTEAGVAMAVERYFLDT